MRIVGGEFKGRTLVEFKGEEIRPTSDKVRESLFNILFVKIANSSVLDLFCGSGNLGIECLSRGASHVHFNDISKESLRVLKQNLNKLKGENDASITNLDYLSCLSQIKGKFDLILIDPPYKFDYCNLALSAIKKHQLLNADGVVVYEWDKPVEEEISGFEKYDQRKYGKTYLNFFKLVSEV